MKHPVPPPGALSKDELLALVKPGQHLYKVYGDCDISGVVCTGKINNKIIDTIDHIDVCHVDNWFGKKYTTTYKYIFDNYFHALAYSLKLKAEHGKPQSKERTGMAGAA